MTTFRHARVNASGIVHAVKPNDWTLCGCRTYPYDPEAIADGEPVTCRTCQHLLATRFAPIIGGHHAEIPLRDRVRR